MSEARGQQADKDENDDLLVRKLALLPDSVKRAILSAREQAASDAQGKGNGGSSTIAVPQLPQAQANKTTPPPPTTQPPPPPPPPSFALRRGGVAVVEGFAPPQDLRAALLEAKALLDAKARPAAMGGGGGGSTAAASDSSSKWRSSSARGDESLFLSPQDAPPALASLARRLASLGPTLRAQGQWDDLQPGGRVELQLARYVGVGGVGGGGGEEGGGGGGDSQRPRYVRHADSNATTSTGAARRVTAVLYLGDEGWDASREGGELALYLPGVYFRGDGGGGGEGGGSGGSSSGNGNGDNGGATTATPEPALRVAPLAGRLAVFDSRLEHEVLPVTAPRGRARVALTAWFHAATPPAGPSAALSPPPPPPPPPHHHHHQQHQPSLAADLAAPILVTVASYRDPETPWTLRDLFAKAANPGRVRCAVVWQGGCNGSNNPNPKNGWPRDQVREVVLPGDEACGPGVARHLALAVLWRGEPLVLQVDSHTRLGERWDEALTLMLRAAEREVRAASSPCSASRGAVISTYPPPYEGAGPSARVPPALSSAAGDDKGTDKAEEQDVTALCATGFSERDGLLRLRCRRVRPSFVPKLAVGRGPDPDDPSLFCPGVLPGVAFWAAGFSFARAEAAALVCCPRLRHLFFGEEAYGLARLYTFGYDVFAPARCVAWHQWGETRAERAARGAAAVEGAAAEVKAMTYAALVAKDPGAQRERAASERRVRRLLDGGFEGGQRGKAATAAASPPPPLEPLWWSAPPGHLQDQDESNDDEDWRPGGRWGLGSARPLEALYERCGVDFCTRSVSDHARCGGLPPGSFFEDEG